MNDFDRFLRWYCADLLDERLRHASGHWLLCAALDLEPERQELPPELALSTALLASVADSDSDSAADPASEPPVVFAIPASAQGLVVFALWRPPQQQPLQPLAAEQWLFWPVLRRHLHAERRSIGLRPLQRAQGEGLSHGALQGRLPALLAELTGHGQ